MHGVPQRRRRMVSAATRKRESQRMKGKKRPHKGHKESAAARAKIRKALRGRKRTARKAVHRRKGYHLKKKRHLMHKVKRRRGYHLKHKRKKARLTHKRRTPAHRVKPGSAARRTVAARRSAAKRVRTQPRGGPRHLGHVPRTHVPRQRRIGPRTAKPRRHRR